LKKAVVVQISCLFEI